MGLTNVRATRQLKGAKQLTTCRPEGPASA